MYSRRLKTGYFVLEGLNSAATVFFLYYFYFYMHEVFGFSNKANLCLAALNGGTYALFAWGGGRFAQRFGYFTALEIGFAVMAAALAVGSQVHSAAGVIVVMVAVVAGMCFTWPTLEALVSEGEPQAGLQHMVGIYNAVWAATGAVAYFAGGAVLTWLGPQGLFYVPMVVMLGQLALTFWLADRVRRMRERGGNLSSRAPNLEEGILRPAGAAAAAGMDDHSPARTKSFLRMAWLANPFAYIGINTLVAVMPGIAHNLELSTTLAGFCGSLWCFARFGTFLGLWLWPGWHYRFRWLLAAYLGLVGAFVTSLLAPNLPVLVAAQMVFGGAIGLIYYSSLFYSMDLSDTKGEHGGIHESAIGLGNCAGPTVGAAALQFFPHCSYSGALAVTVLLLCGLGGLAAVWWSGQEKCKVVRSPGFSGP
jgi:predicted MFS family arabinose efflux permease